MELLIIRKLKGAEATLGSLFIDEEYVCDTLEPHCIDWSTEKKVWGKTAIPEGRYQIEWRESPHFKRVMPYLKDIPHFANVMIHPGNSVKDTQGCILVGKTPPSPLKGENSPSNGKDPSREGWGGSTGSAFGCGALRCGVPSAVEPGSLTNSRATFEMLLSRLRQCRPDEEIWVTVR